MLKYYISRYMDLKKCEEIKREATCKICGFDLEGQHRTDFQASVVKEVLVCPRCSDFSVTREFLLH